ncbi:Hypothetical predicted protein [Podarcis lilfordi]|uniref:Uncharacterized protein n=1 Tax=Podarcis lilfordi TaxID=74358 RepID=A0AA35KI57_9SAUR|nr:Hypothetical predicted protein [Podarcis lilfordi]
MFTPDKKRELNGLPAAALLHCRSCTEEQGVGLDDPPRSLPLLRFCVWAPVIQFSLGRNKLGSTWTA